MKIGIDCRLYSPKYTGIGRYVFELVRHLIELDQSNNYILYFNQEEYDSFNIPNEHWQKRLIDIPHYSMAEQTRFSKILKADNLDLVHFPHFNAPVTYKKPFIVTIHDLTLHYYPDKSYNPKASLKKKFKVWIYKFIMGRVVKNARHIIAVSDNTRKDLLREYSIPEEKVSTVLEGVPAEFRKATEDNIEAVRIHFNVDKPYLLYTGVWRSHKNLLNLLRAFKILVDSGKDIQLVITGKRDPAYPEIPRLIKELDLDSRVVLTGFVSDKDLIALNSGATVFVFPTLYEGFGLPPLEAMRFGVPVACSDSSSLPQVCADAALYFDPSDIEDIAGKIAMILDDEELRQQLIAKGTENLKRFSWNKMAGEILDIYNA